MRSRAADDFDAIRVRMEELQRERGQVVAERERLTAACPRPYSVTTRPAIAEKRNLQAVFRRLRSG